MNETLEAVEVRDGMLDRTTGLGGSDASAACGLSRRKSRVQLVEEKLGIIPPMSDEDAPDYFRWGRLLEPIVRQEFSNRTGLTVRLPTETLRHPDFPWMMSHPDGIVADAGGRYDHRRLYEGKISRSSNDWGEDGSDEIPRDVRLQTEHNVFVARAVGIKIELIDVVVLIAGSDYRHYMIEPDDEIQQALFEQERELWEEYITKGLLPPPTTVEECRRRFGSTSVGREVTASTEAAEAVRRLRDLKDTMKEADAEIDRLTTLVMYELGDADTLVDVDDTVLATWKQAKAPMRLDQKTLKADHPEIYNAYVAPGTASRRFLIKVK